MRVHQKILVIDVETTGLDPARHACIELGAVMLDESLCAVQEFSSLLAPWDGAEIVEQAMKVNQITVEQLNSAPPMTHVVEHFHETFRSYGTTLLLGGWNVWFDASFLRNLYERSGREWPFKYRLLDVQSIISFHALMAGLSQEKAIEKLLNERQKHRALDDARHTSRLLQLMAEHYYENSVHDLFRA